jgi:hypothetical protein
VSSAVASADSLAASAASLAKAMASPYVAKCGGAGIAISVEERNALIEAGAQEGAQ